MVFNITEVSSGKQLTFHDGNLSVDALTVGDVEFHTRMAAVEQTNASAIADEAARAVAAEQTNANRIVAMADTSSALMPLVFYDTGNSRVVYDGYTTAYSDLLAQVADLTARIVALETA